LIIPALVILQTAYERSCWYFIKSPPNPLIGFGEGGDNVTDWQFLFTISAFAIVEYSSGPHYQKK
jgi:hypothetical protein